MKNIPYWVLFILTILISTSTKAQYPLLEYIYPSSDATLNEILYAGNGNWITSYSLGEFELQLEKTNPLGNTIWQHKLVTDSFQYSTNINTVPSLNMIQTIDQGIIVAASMNWWCHVFGSNFTSSS